MECFLAATGEFGIPSCVRMDLDGENMRIWEFMEEVCGSKRVIRSAELNVSGVTFIKLFLLRTFQFSMLKYLKINDSVCITSFFLK